MAAINLGAMYPIGGIFKSGNPDISSSTDWMVAASRRFDAPTTMKVVYPPQGANEQQYDAHKWADTKSEYSVRICIRGGEPPLRVIQILQPEWAQLGSGVVAQDFVKASASVPATYEFTIPSFYMTVKGTPSATGGFSFSYIVMDQTGATVSVNWSGSVDDSGRIKYLDAVSGSDTNSGTFELPFQTWPKMWNLANADQYIFKLKSGTYTVSDGSGGNANFGTGKPRAIIGLNASTTNLDMSAALISGASDNIVIKNLTISGAPAASANPKQIGFNNRASGAHICGVRFSTRVGTDGGDNPCGIFFPDVGATKSINVSVVDCELLSTSTSSLAVYFSCEDLLEENNVCAGVAFPQTNGSLVSHFKGRIVNATQRFCNYSADSNNGLVWVSNQNPEDCANIELVCSRYVNVGTGNGSPLRFNGQVHSPPMERPAGMLVQRCSIAGGDNAPMNLEDYRPGFDVEYSGILWSSSIATTLDSTGGVALPISLKVSDIDLVAAPMIGIGSLLLSEVYT